jgi:hypothetical protein
MPRRRVGLERKEKVMVTGEVKSTLWRLLVVTACMVSLMGATEPGCEPLDRPTDPDDPADPGDPGDPTDDCTAMYDRCLAAGEPECEAVFDFCRPVEPPPVDPCGEDYSWCLDAGEPPEICDEVYMGCIGPVEDPCMTQYDECLAWGVDPYECELQLEACYGWTEDPCVARYDECLAMGVDPYACDEEYWSCTEPPPPCFDMYERCVAAEPDPSVCDVILIYCEPGPVDPCAAPLAACDPLMTTCYDLEALFSFCWYEEAPSEECQRFFDEDTACWTAVSTCQTEAFEICYPAPPDPCAPLLAGCEPLVEPCSELEETFSFCWYEETPSEECQRFFEEDNACWSEYSRCSEDVYAICSPPDPCAEPVAACDPLAAPCSELEEAFAFCWYEETPSDLCLAFYDQDDACWGEYSRCVDEAYAGCSPTEPIDQCAWVGEICATGEASPEDCELMLAECAPEPVEPPVATCEEELDACYASGLPPEECEANFFACGDRGR